MFRLLALLGAGMLGTFVMAPDQEIENEQASVSRAAQQDIVLASSDTDAPSLIKAVEDSEAEVNEATSVVVFPPADRVAKMTSAPLVKPMLSVSSSDAPAGYVSKAKATPQATTTVSSENLRYVSGNRVNMRSGPSTSNGVIRALSRGAATELIGQDNGWAHIRDLASGDTGYMSAKFLTK